MSFSGFSASWRQVYYTLIYSFMLGAALWVGNVSINPALDRIFRNSPLSPGNKLALSLVQMVIISASVIIGVNWLFYGAIAGIDFWEYVSKGGAVLSMAIAMGVVVIITLVLYTQEFFRSWREVVTNEEALKREKLALEYEALKNQVNPHFLFNSLNSLSNLIGKDDDKAGLFVKKLSNIYRYVLEQKDREAVPLATELNFLENYVDLMRIRFGENLRVNIELPEAEGVSLIPMSLQMLVENAIKHNIVSAENPLTIHISMRGRDHLEVSNNLQRRSSILSDEHNGWEKHGLRNISSRYVYLTGGVFKVNGAGREPYPEELNGKFVVNIPLIR